MQTSLFFKPVRLGGEDAYCERCEQPHCCAKGSHHREPLFSAIKIENMRKNMTVSVIVSCLAHIPRGAWVEGHGIIQRQAPPWRRKGANGS